MQFRREERGPCRKFSAIDPTPLIHPQGTLSRAHEKSSAAAAASEKSDEQWRKELTAEQYRVLRQHGTERAGSSALNREHRPGTFRCAGCGTPLFSSDTKFESGSGWPSFYQPLHGAVATADDDALGMHRTEVHCARCGGHLGHVFPDGPRPTGERYCMNGAALDFVPAEANKTP